MDQNIKPTVDQWLDNLTEQDLLDELKALVAADTDELYDAFYRSLEFGTAGLRGVIGVGTNRMNVHVVAQATQGVADYLNAHYSNPSVALARDSRNKGEEFQRVAAGVLAANGVHVYVYPRIEPVPALSFAVRRLGTSAGIVLTASHNPAKYNGSSMMMHRAKATTRLSGPPAVSSHVPVSSSQLVPSMHPIPMATRPK